MCAAGSMSMSWRYSLTRRGLCLGPRVVAETESSLPVARGHRDEVEKVDRRRLPVLFDDDAAFLGQRRDVDEVDLASTTPTAAPKACSGPGCACRSD